MKVFITVKIKKINFKMMKGKRKRKQCVNRS